VIWQGQIHGMTIEAHLGMLTTNSKGYSFQFPIVFVVDNISLFHNSLPIELSLCGVQFASWTRRIWGFPPILSFSYGFSEAVSFLFVFSRQVEMAVMATNV